MRFAPTLFVPCYVTKEPVPFQERLTLKLKPRVSGKNDRMSNISCVYEMSIMFACFKSNDFNQAPCSKEIESFQKCYTKDMASKQGRKQKESLGILSPGEKNLSPKQVNTLLRMFPNTK